jgi:hypothetical protein
MNTAKTLILVALVAVGLGCGYSKPANMPPAPGTMPTITNLNPSSATHNNDVPMAVTGTNFNTNAYATITLNGTATKLTPGSGNTSTSMSVTIPASAIPTMGTAQVTVTNPGQPAMPPYGGGTQTVTSQPMNFTVN